jgi:hypothetical protein
VEVPTAYVETSGARMARASARQSRNKLAASLDLTRRLAAALDVKVDDLFVSAERRLSRSSLQPAESRLLAVVRQLEEPQIDDLVRALRTLLAVGASASATATAARARRARLAQG